ncbi:MAG: S8 family serine peptidase, partial [Bacteroidota bacterium]
MRRSTLVFLCFFTFCWAGLTAQTLLRDYDFDDGNLNDWVNVAFVGTSMDGTAAVADAFWNGRDTIASQSGNFAALFGLEGGALRSPEAYDFSAEPGLFLTFHQYYRRFQGETYVNVYQDGLELARIQINDRLNEGVETAHFDTVIVDLTPYKNNTNLIIEFENEPSDYFWLIDDVQLWNGFPTPQTVPDTMGNYLAANDYPYEIDSARWAYVPYQLVVQFNPDNASQFFRDSLREANGARLLESCACDQLELWEIDGSAFAVDASGTPFPVGGSTNVQSNKLGKGTKGKVDGVDLNYYNGVLLEADSISIGVGDSLSQDSINNLDPRVEGALKIAILDTGIDYKHPKLRPFIHLGPDLLSTESVDEDENCLRNDPIGWNFVVNHNNPYDDNSHGTHVAGILVDSLERFSGCDFEIIPYKTHDNNGISTLFDVACATFQAVKDDVDLINDSWGFFGDSSTVLSNAIDSAALADILIISAAGNDGLRLDTLPQYPACYDAENVITVGATETFIDPNENNIERLRPAFFTNQSRFFVDVMANGTDVNSTVPGGGRDSRGIKSGTSMATPMVTAGAALAICAERSSGASSGEITFERIRDSLLSCLDTDFLLRNAADQGRYLQLTDASGCLTTSTATPT